MKSVPRNELVAEPDVQETITKMKTLLLAELPEGTFAQQEEAVLAVLEEVGRETLEQRLVEIAASFPDVILVDGVAYKRHQPGVGAYHSLSGPLRPSRDTYRMVGVHNGPTVVPLELAAGIVEGATPALGYNIAHGYACHDMRQHGEALEAAHRVPPARATLERMAKLIAASAVTAAPRIEMECWAATLSRAWKPSIPTAPRRLWRAQGRDRQAGPRRRVVPEPRPQRRDGQARPERGDRSRVGRIRHALSRRDGRDRRQPTSWRRCRTGPTSPSAATAPTRRGVTDRSCARCSRTEARRSVEPPSPPRRP